MKWYRLVPAVLLILLLAFFTSPALAGETPAFTADDLNVNAVYAGASPADAHTAFGSPIDTETVSVPATGDTQVVWSYDRLTLTFADESLIAAEWSDPTLTGSRGLKIGDGEETVVGAFYADAAQADADVLYTSGWVAELGMQLPSSGIITHDADGSFAVNYVAPLEPYGREVQDDPMMFVYQTHASLTFTFDVKGKLVNIRWSEGPLAE